MFDAFVLRKIFTFEKRKKKSSLFRYLEQLFPHSRTHLLIHHKNNNAPVVHSSSPRSAGHLDVLT